ncbi:MAG: DUF2339 domain-containing protein [Sulfurovum sp.]|nr:DUF2339 domain-containing protein [Sulfurovum sp.]
MNTSALLFIILGFWIFVLQSKIKHLESLVNKLLKSRENHVPVVKEDDLPIDEAILEKEALAAGSVEAWEATHTSEMKAESDAAVPDAVDNENDTGAPMIAHAFEEESSVESFKETHAEERKVERHSSLEYESQESSKIFTFVQNYFTGGNLLVRIGSVILFFGLAFLVKYAAEHSVISIEMRLWFVAFVSFALIGLGWKLRHKEGAYGQILQGLGVAILYLLIYAAAKFYALIGLDTAFLLMLVVVIVGSMLATFEDSLPLAVFATAGGFLVPILTSTGEGSHVLLFSYYALLNLGVFALAWYRSWRVLNLLGFVFTFVISGVWGTTRYAPELFASTEPFLILYFLMYVGIAILFTIKHPYEPKNLVDGTLVFGLPIVVFPLQLNLVSTFEHGNAYSAVALGLFYVSLFVFLKNKERTSLLSQSFLALGVVFLTIAVPYIFDADVSAALWSLESAGMIWLALKQNKIYTRYFGEALLVLSVFVYPYTVHFGGVSVAEYLGYIILISAVLAGAYLLDTHRPKLFVLDRILSKVLLGVSVLLWLMGTSSQFEHFDINESHTLLFSLLLYVPILLLIVKTLKWEMLVEGLQTFVPLGLLFSFASLLEVKHPFEGIGPGLFIGFIVVYYGLLYLYSKVWTYASILHIIAPWFVAIVGVLELRYQTSLLGLSESVQSLATILLPFLLALLLLLPKQYFAWLESQREKYQFISAGGFMLVSLLWTVKTFAVPASQNFYFPLLNLLDLGQLLVLSMMVYWVFKNVKHFSRENQNYLYVGVTFLLALLITVVFARAVHVYGGVEYTLVNLWKDNYFQTGLSILWSIIAIVLMLLSKRYAHRMLWLAGFGLLIVVVLKLFVVELASSGTIERIISFIVVGSLLLLIGYFVPLPPHKEGEDTKKEEVV